MSCSPSKTSCSLSKARSRPSILFFKLGVHVVIGIAKAISLAIRHNDIVIKIAKPETVGNKVCCYRASSQARIRARRGAMNDARAPKEDISLLEWWRIHFWSFRRQVVLNLFYEVHVNSIKVSSSFVVGSAWHEVVSSRVDVEADALGKDILECDPCCDQMPIWARVEKNPILVRFGGGMVEQHRLIQCEID